MKKRILVVADLHCGHYVGLTPPGWQTKGAPELGPARNKLTDIQQSCWNFYERKVAEHGPFDVIFVNGDCIDGRGERSGGTEILEPNRQRQCDMAVVSIRKAITKPSTPVVMTYGTPYHTGDAEDWESGIASDLNAKIGSHEWVEVEGVIFDLKHHTGSSSIPHGRHTPAAREHLWNQLWSARGQNPTAHVIIRSHVHYLNHCGGPGWLSLTTPALQGWGTKYGSRRCSGIIDYGFLVFECEKGQWRWWEVLLTIPTLTTKTIKL